MQLQHKRTMMPSLLQSLTGHQTAVDSVTFDHGEEVVAAGAQSGSIKLFDLDAARGGVLGCEVG
jgi:WD40 repeat protein